MSADTCHICNFIYNNDGVGSIDEDVLISSRLQFETINSRAGLEENMGITFLCGKKQD